MADINNAKRDGNHITSMLFVGSDGLTYNVEGDEATGRIYVDLAGGSGTVTSVSVVSANGFAGTVATATTTPAITLSTTVNSPVLAGNGTAISAATTTGSGSTVVLNNSPVFADDITVGVAASATGSILFKGITSGTVTLSVADAAGTWTMKLPTTDGNANEFLQTDGSGNTTWANVNTIPATTITVANEATDTTCFPVFVTAATGDLGPKSNANLTFNSNTGALASSLFSANTITANTAFVPDTDGGADLGTTTLGFQNLHLNTGATINIDNSNWVATHTSGILTVGTGDLRVTTAGTNTASVVTVGGTQTLTSKTLTSPTITTATLSGTQQFAEGAGIAYDAASSADGVYTGFVRAGTAGATLAFGDLVYLAAADSRWELADADSATTADRFLGMCVLAAASDGDPTTILLTGFIRADAAFPALTIGSPVYVGETAGDIQTSIPTGADNVIRRVGYAWTADELYFNPSMDSQTTVA